MPRENGKSAFQEWAETIPRPLRQLFVRFARACSTEEELDAIVGELSLHQARESSAESDLEESSDDVVGKGKSPSDDSP